MDAPTAVTKITGVKHIWTGRVVQVTAKYGDAAPMVGVCCNACRTCVTTNLVGMVTAAIGGTGYAAARFVRRVARR